jgi:hypothetical protein
LIVFIFLLHLDKCNVWNISFVIFKSGPNAQAGGVY